MSRDNFIERDLYGRQTPVHEELIKYHDQPYDEYRFRIMKDTPPDEQRRQLQYARLEVLGMAQEIRERERNDMRVAYKVVEMLRGLNLSDEAYHIMRSELEHGYDRHRNDRLKHHEEEIYLKHMMNAMQREIQAKEIQAKPERKDFLEEEEMIL